MVNRILIIEDELPLAEALAQGLYQEGYAAVVAASAAEGLRRASMLLPDLILLDLGLPDFDGLEVCRRLRASERTRRLPILMVTARAEVADELGGFAAGADDYVVKPFSFKVLALRIKRLLRPLAGVLIPPDSLEHLEVRIDRRRHRTFAHGQEVNLTATEFRLLEFLLRQPGRAFTRQELLQALAKEDCVLDRNVDLHVRRLRHKLGLPDFIETVRGRGYRLQESVLGAGNELPGAKQGMKP